MNHIEQILSNSVFNSSEFNASQINALNEMVNNDISEEQVCIIAHPAVNELSYSILYDYLTKHHITSNEYQTYLNIDVNRVNDIIINVYLGKLHGLSDEQINLYAQRSVFNIKIARLLVEHAKDASPEQLSKLVNGKFGTKSIIGKQAIQDYINGDLPLDKLLCMSILEEISQDEYEFIKKADRRILSILNDAFTRGFLGNSTKNILTDKYLKQSINIDDNDKFINKCIDDVIVHCDTLATFYKLLKFTKIIANSKRSWLYEVCQYYKYNFTINTPFIKLFDYKDFNVCYFKNDKNDIKYDFFETIVRNYFDDHCIFISESEDIYIKYKEEFSTFDEYLEVFMNTNGFEDYIRAKWIDKVSDKTLNDIKQGNSLDILCNLYKTEKDQKIEIPYLKEMLKDIDYTQLKEVICMKENQCSNDEIHLYIENYLSKGTCKPSMYFNKDNNYNKYWNIVEFLKLNELNDNYFNFDKLYRLKEAGCTEEDIQFVIDNKLKISASLIQKELIDLYKDYGASNLQYVINTNRYITYTNDETKIIIENYNYAKSIFKDKVKCIGYYINCDKLPRISEHLIKYIDNFSDDVLFNIIHTNDTHFIHFCLKMSTITTNFNILNNMFNEVSNNSVIETFTNKDEKVTKDVVIKFCKNAKIDVPKELFEDQAEIFIEKSVDYFGSSKNFKPIKYDEETIYVDIIGNKALKGNHIITFNKEDDDTYEYIFEIAHEEETLTYSAKITTKKDIIDCINKSIALIENIDEYYNYVEELQELLKTI